ncbi:MAG: PepSY domain-containing protein [Fimbriimonadaceae bacterium]|nr:PepSY domain-containing protein [Fimbriimonadaceae bacterium]
MYRTLRVAHRWIGIFACLFLVLVSATGFLLSLKRSVEWIQPATRKGSVSSTVIPLEQVYATVFALGIAELQTVAHVDRVDYRPEKNIFKVLSNEGYHEVQVDGADGSVLSVSQRRDHFFEDLHDLRFFSDHLHTWVLPAVALALFALGFSGLVMFFVPVARRWKFRRRSA